MIGMVIDDWVSDEWLLVVGVDEEDDRWLKEE